jgi:hypothetical protein
LGAFLHAALNPRDPHGCWPVRGRVGSARSRRATRPRITTRVCRCSAVCMRTCTVSRGPPGGSSATS